MKGFSQHKTADLTKKQTGPKAVKKQVKQNDDVPLSPGFEDPIKIQKVQREGLVPGPKMHNKAFLKSQREEEVKRSDLDEKGKTIWDKHHKKSPAKKTEDEEEVKAQTIEEGPDFHKKLGDQHYIGDYRPRREKKTKVGKKIRKVADAVRGGTEAVKEKRKQKQKKSFDKWARKTHLITTKREGEEKRKDQKVEKRGKRNLRDIRSVRKANKRKGELD